MKHISNFAIILFVLLSISCDDKQSSRKSGDDSKERTAASLTPVPSLSNKQYSDDFNEAEIQLIGGVSSFSVLEFEYRQNWEERFFVHVSAADIESGKELNRQGKGGTVSNEVQQVIALEQAERDHGRIERFMDKIKDPPIAYAPAYAKLIEAYGAYEELYRSVISPSGPIEAYRATAAEKQRKFDSLEAQVTALEPKPQK